MLYLHSGLAILPPPNPGKQYIVSNKDRVLSTQPSMGPFRAIHVALD